MRKLWTQDEIAFLEDNYVSAPIQLIYSKLGRTESSIRHKASRMGIHKPNHLLDFQWCPTLAQLGYLAGCLDCDGTITINVGQRRAVPKRRGSRCEIRPKVVFFNTDEHMIKELHRIVTVGSIRKYWGNRSTKPLFVYTITGTKIYTLLKALLPFLVRKKKHAELVLQFYKLRESKAYNASYGQEEWEIVEKMRELNK